MTSESDILDAPLSAYVVDDELQGRLLVSRLLRQNSVFAKIELFSGGAAAIEALKNYSPDVVFLDISMPIYCGLEVAKSLEDSNSLIVFVTAHERYALDAFKVSAFDYILKPIDKDRFEDVVERACSATRRRRLESIFNPTNTKANFPRDSWHSSNSLNTLRVRKGYESHFIFVDNVVWFEAANQYVKIHTMDSEYLTSAESLSSIITRLDPAQFLRVHRSAIVNVNFISKTRIDNHGAHFVEMKNGANVRVSRSNKGKLASLSTSAP